MKAILVLIAKKTGYVLAAFIIIAAIFVSMAYLLSPVLEKHRGEIETWASELLAKPVTIQKVQLSWYQYYPEVSLNGVTIFDTQKKSPLLEIKKIRIFFSILSSVWQRKPVINGIMIDGTEINIRQAANKEISVQGFTTLGELNNRPLTNETKLTDITAWLFNYSHLILKNIDVQYNGFAGQKRFVTLSYLKLENTNDHHQVSAKVILHQEIPVEVIANTEWFGNEVDPIKIKANIYFYVTGFSLSQWMQGYTWNNWTVTQGMVSAKIWALWDQGTFQKIQNTFQIYALDLYSKTDKKHHLIKRLSGNLGWKRENNTQIFAGNDILIDFASHLWPVTNFYVEMQQNNGNWLLHKINIGYLDLKDVQSFLFSSPKIGLPDNLYKALSGLSLNGSLKSINFVFPALAQTNELEWMKSNIHASFNHLSFSPWRQFPSANNLNGDINWNNGKGEIVLNSKQTTFQYDTVFANPLYFEQLTANLEVQQNTNQEWFINVTSLQLLNKNLSANAIGTITLPLAKSPLINLDAHFTMPKANQITQYLPLKIFDKELVKWLRKAFLSGEITSGNAVLRGALYDFPFDQGNGTFLISGTVNNVDFHFAPGWPTIKNINGKLTFSGRQMLAEVDQAHIFNIPITNVTGNIPYLGDVKPQVLEIKSNTLNFDFMDGLKFIHNSPLNTSIGKMFEDLELHGPVTLNLSLQVPLKHAEKTALQGNLFFKEAEMDLLPWNLAINHVNGMLHFTENSIDAKNIVGQLFNKPLQLDLATLSKQNNASTIQASFITNISSADLENWLKVPFSKVINGAADIKGTIDLSLKTPILIHLQSKLMGMAVNLPNRFAKAMQDERDVIVEIIAQAKEALKLQLKYADLFSAAIILNQKNHQFQLLAADLYMGNGMATWPKDNGLYITGDFETLDWDTIKSYVEQGSSVDFSNIITLRGIDIFAKAIHFAGLNLQQVRLKINPIANKWDINIDSPDINGQLEVPKRWTASESLKAQFKKFNINASLTSKTKLDIKVKSLPAISFLADNFTYNNMPFGQVYFKTTPSLNGLKISDLHIVSSSFDLQGAGSWTQTGNAYTTHLQGNAKSPQVSAFLNGLGLDVRNFISSNGNIAFNLSWNDAPYSPTLASLNGNASIQLGPGRIVDIGQEGGAKMDLGRMLSIFSLQTIPRRLSFDFSDVFQKGYSFDSVQGDLNLQNGDAYTKNFYFNGPVARVGINGRIGLKNKDYNFTLIVTPYVTSSIPIAATLITGNPLIGLAAFGVNTVLSQGVSKVITYYYAVTGPWSNPTWKSVSFSQQNRSK